MVVIIPDTNEYTVQCQQKLTTLHELDHYCCAVCGMDEWCGTDGCPLDPQ